MSALLLAVRGLRSRLALSVAVLATAVAVTAGAAAGPLYLRAGQESLLRDALTEVGQVGAGAQVSRSGPAARDRFDDLQRTVAEARAGFVDHPSQIAAVELDGSVLDTGGRTIASGRLAFPDGACEQLVVLEGRCPEAAGEVLAGEASAGIMSTGLGGAVRFGGLEVGGPPRPLRIVGIYGPSDPAEDYWHGGTYFPLQRAQPSEATFVDTFFTPRTTFEDASATVRMVVDVPIDIGTVRLAHVADLRAGAAAFERAARAFEPGSGVRVTSFLGTWLDVAERRGDALVLPVVMAIAQLLALGWLVTFTVMGNAAAARRAEVGLAKLRGFGPVGLVTFTVAETGLLLVAATPIGVVAAVALVRLLASARLAPGTPVALTVPAVLAVAATVAGGLAAAVGTSVRVLRASVLELQRRATQAGHGRRRAGVAALLAIVVAAVARRQAAHAGDEVGPLALAGLAALVGGVAGAAGLSLALRLGVRATRASPHVAVFLAVRQLARRTGSLRTAVVLVAAAALAMSAVATWSVFTGNHRERALAENGAVRVLTVAVPRGANLRDVVRTADPGGGDAMAVQWSIAAGARPVLVGIDTDRYARIGFWRHDLGDLAAIVGQLQSPGPEGGVVAIAGSDVVVPEDGRITGTGLDGREVPVVVVARPGFVPRFGPRGMAVDLAALEAASAGDLGSRASEVWLRTERSGPIVDRLERAGVRVIGMADAGAREDRFRRQPPSLGLVLFLAGAVLALVLAVAGAALDVFLLGRRRAFELAAMRTVGVRARTLRRSVVVEHLLLLLPSTLFGAVAGLLAAQASLPSVPEYVDAPALPPLVLTPDAGVVLVVVAVIVVAVLTTAAASAAAIVRVAGADRLREVEP